MQVILQQLLFMDLWQPYLYIYFTLFQLNNLHRMSAIFLHLKILMAEHSLYFIVVPVVAVDR